MTPDQLEHDAVRAVVSALRPRALEQLVKHATWPAPTPPETAMHEIQHSLSENLHTDRTVPFWSATGPQLTAALQVVVDVEEDFASYLIGAALHALILARQDTAPDAVLRLAERAASWYSGWLAASTHKELP